MKLTFIFLLVCNTFVFYSQLNELKGVWVSKEQDCIAIKDIANKYDDSNIIGNKDRQEGVAVFLYGETLSFQKRYYTAESDYKTMLADSFNFKIKSRTEKSMTLVPVSALASKFFGNRSKIIFIKQELNRDNSIQFEKLIFHSTGCYGSCPEINLEIKSDKQIYLDGKFFKDFSMFDIDSTLTGKFAGTLDDNLYYELVDLLQKSNLKTLEYKLVGESESPINTLIIYFNGQRKYIKVDYSPVIIEGLIDYLYTINQRAILTKTGEERVLEE